MAKSKVSKKGAVGVLAAEKQTKITNLIRELATELSAVPSFSKQESRTFFNLSGDEKRLLRERNPHVLANRQYATGSLNTDKIMQGLNDGQFLENLLPDLADIMVRCERGARFAYAVAYEVHADFIAAVDVAAEREEPGAADLAEKLRINLVRIEAAKKTRRDSKKKQENSPKP